MWGTVRVALAILVLPVSVIVLIPLWIARDLEPTEVLPDSGIEWSLAAAGLVVLAAGFALFISCVARFWRQGRGTLAPWDPPTALVVSGPYTHVRNPMISGVILVLIAEAMLFRTLPHVVWAALFFLLNTIVIPAVEEPVLRARFGEQYIEYCRRVPRLIPRLRPYLGAR